MKRVRLTALVAILALAGCGATAEAPAEISVPVAPTATASVAHTGAISRSPRRRENSLFRALPGECGIGRVYVQAEALLGASGADALDAVIDKLVAAVAGSRGERMQRVMREAGLGAGAVREMAFCLDNKAPVFAFRVRERALRTDLADALVQLFGSFEMEAAREQHGDVTWVVGGAKVAAAVLEDVVVLAEKRDTLEDALLVGGSKGEFADAPSYLVWVQTKELSATVLPVREMYQLGALMPPPPRFKDRWAQDPAGVIAEMRAGIDAARKTLSTSPFKPALPVLENMTIERAGDEIRIDSAFPSSVMPDIYAAIERSSLQDLTDLVR